MGPLECSSRAAGFSRHARELGSSHDLRPVLVRAQLRRVLVRQDPLSSAEVLSDERERGHAVPAAALCGVHIHERGHARLEGLLCLVGRRSHSDEPPASVETLEGRKLCVPEKETGTGTGTTEGNRTTG